MSVPNAFDGVPFVNSADTEYYFESSGLREALNEKKEYPRVESDSESDEGTMPNFKTSPPVKHVPRETPYLPQQQGPDDPFDDDQWGELDACYYVPSLASIKPHPGFNTDSHAKSSPSIIPVLVRSQEVPKDDIIAKDNGSPKTDADCESILDSDSYSDDDDMDTSPFVSPFVVSSNDASAVEPVYVPMNYSTEEKEVNFFHRIIQDMAHEEQTNDDEISDAEANIPNIQLGHSLLGSDDYDSDNFG